MRILIYLSFLVSLFACPCVLFNDQSIPSNKLLVLSSGIFFMRNILNLECYCYVCDAC